MCPGNYCCTWFQYSSNGDPGRKIETTLSMRVERRMKYPTAPVLCTVILLLMVWRNKYS